LRNFQRNASCARVQRTSRFQFRLASRNGPDDSSKLPRVMFPQHTPRSGRRLGPALWLAAIVGISACATAPGAHVPNLFDAQRQVDRYITSGQYEAELA